MSIAKWFAANFNPADVFWLAPREDEKSIQVEDTTAWTQRVHFGAVGDKKIFIITDVSIMTVAAQNKILKTVEDQRSDTVFLLLATDIARVLPTIQSRCVRVSVTPPPPAPPSPESLNAAKKLLTCKTLDEMLPYIPHVTLPALTIAVGRDYHLLKVLSTIQRNIQSNANPTNAMDLFVIELLKQKNTNTR